MKRMFFIILLAIFVVSVYSCDSGEVSNSTNPTPNVETEMDGDTDSIEFDQDLLEERESFEESEQSDFSEQEIEYLESESNDLESDAESTESEPEVEAEKELDIDREIIDEFESANELETFEEYDNDNDENIENELDEELEILNESETDISYCQNFPALWPSQINSNSPTLQDVFNMLSQNSSSSTYYMSFSQAQGQNLIDSQYRVYLPYGTERLMFAIANHTTVATYLLRIDGTPTTEDVQVDTSPALSIYGDCLYEVCPYTRAIYDLYGGDQLIAEVKNYCPSFQYPNLICSSPNSLWDGHTFNAVQNTTIIQVPEEFWDAHPKGAWLVFIWLGGRGGNAFVIDINKQKFDTWFEQLSDEAKNTPIGCPIE